MSSFYNGGLKLSIYGESHGKGIGVVIDNLPAGEKLDFDEISDFMQRRAAKTDGTSTYRVEPDRPEVLSGFYNGKTTGNPLSIVIYNKNQRSEDYKSVSYLARPSHADYTGYVRYNGANDLRGGGHFSGRLTAGLVFAGAVCSQILERKGIVTGAHIYSINKMKDKPFDPINITAEELKQVRNRHLPLLDYSKNEEMIKLINTAREELDSLGGIVECAAVGVPVGIGSPIFDGLENVISQLVFGIPAVRGIEFGLGFDATLLKGSQHNDEFYMDNASVKTRTNNHGGILGGISSGMPILFRVPFKPTASILLPQDTVDYVKKTDEKLEIKGRHDPCIVPRAVPCVESALNIALLSALV